jgi:acetyltransferase-like isoleucine patch superfamily enzyme
MEVIRKFSKALLLAYHMLGFATLAAALLAVACRFVSAAFPNVAAAWWMAAAPLLYGAWLVLFLSISAANMQLMHRLGWRKPRRFETRVGAESPTAAMTYAVIMRFHMINSLPGARYLLKTPGLDRLVLYAYSARVRVGRNCQIWGEIQDPDLTTLGESVVLGGEVSLSSHALTTRPDGTAVYVSAPIEIGPRVVIGANTRIALGAQIGADAMVLPGSDVVPFAKIPENQVWGGNPAVFLRHRDPVEVQQPAATPAPEPARRSSCTLMPTTICSAKSGGSWPRRSICLANGSEPSFAATTAANGTRWHRWRSLRRCLTASD